MVNLSRSLSVRLYVCAILSGLNLYFRGSLEELKDLSWRNSVKTLTNFHRCKIIDTTLRYILPSRTFERTYLSNGFNQSGKEIFFVHVWVLIRNFHLNYLTYKCNEAHIYEIRNQLNRHLYLKLLQLCIDILRFRVRVDEATLIFVYIYIWS